MAFFLGIFGYSAILSSSWVILGLKDEVAIICFTVLDGEKIGKVYSSATYSASEWSLFTIRASLKLIAFVKPTSNSIHVTSYPVYL